MPHNKTETVCLNEYFIKNKSFSVYVDSIIDNSYECEKFPKDSEWYIAVRKLDEEVFIISVSIVDEDFLLTYTELSDIKGLIHSNNTKIFILHSAPEELFCKKSTNIKVNYNYELKSQNKPKMKPIIEYPTWKYTLKGDIITENKFNSYDCKVWNL